MAYRKPFEKDLYDAYDNPAKVALIKVLQSAGHDVKTVSENYYADVESLYDGATHYSEAEVKLAWHEEWPESWAEIRIPERKSRLIKKYNGNVTFFVFNKGITQCWKIQGKALSEDLLRPAFGRNIRAGELFFHYPYKKATLLEVPQ